MLNHSRITERYRFSGTLTLETALHIGTGQVATVTDSPILRNTVGEPFIPGSSLKGAFRAAVARIAPNLGEKFQACDPFGNDGFCISPQKSGLNDAYRHVRSFLDRALPSQRAENNEEVNKALDALEIFSKPAWKGKILLEKDLLELLEEKLCSICKVFGSPYYAAIARFDDLAVLDWFNVSEIRDGVGIDRDSERAIEGIKYDFEVVPAGSTFKFGLTLENPSDQDKGLIAIGLREMEEGMIRLGGIRSRGLGACRLALDEVQYLNARDPKMLMVYLKGERAGQTISKETFLNGAMDALFQNQEV